MFDFVLQLNSGTIFRVFDEMRRAALPVLPDTLENLDPFDLGGGITAEVVINLPDQLFPLALNAETQTAEIVLGNIAFQTRLVDPAFPGDILFESEVSYLVSLPLSVIETDDALIIGSDPAHFNASTVLAVIGTGHPLEDDDVLQQLISRQLQSLITDGGFPFTMVIDDQPLEGLPLELSMFLRFMNDVDNPGSIAASVELSPQPNRVVLIAPLEVWANVEAAGTDTVLRHVQALVNLRVTVPVVRDLNPQTGPAVITVRLSLGEAELEVIEIIEGGDITQDAVVWAQIQAFVRSSVGDVLRDFGDQTVTTPSLDQFTQAARNMLRQRLERDGAVLPFLEMERNEQFSSAELRIHDDILTIGINPRPGANISEITPFIPPNRDFAARFDGEAALEEIATRLVAPDHYDDISGRLSLQELTPEGSTTIVVGGFSAESGTVRRRTHLRIDRFLYGVNGDVDIARLPDDDASPATGDDRNQATLSISPALRSNLTAGERVRFEAGVGLPITQDAGGNDRTFRINDDLTPTLGDGHIRLAGTGRLRRPHVVIRNIDANISMRLALDWASDTQVRGGGQSGSDLNVRTLAETLRQYRAGSQIFIDDDRDAYGITANVDGGDTTLALSRDLDQSPQDRGMVASRWVQIGSVDGNSQTGNMLRISGMTEGEGLIPAGAVFRVSGQNFTIEQDATISDDGRATLMLNRRLDSELEDAPDDGAAIQIFGGWWGRGAIDGDAQLDRTISISELVRYLPGGTRLSIAGVNGVFRTRDEAAIVDDAATVTLDHLALDEIQSLLGDIDDDRLWDLVGQPVGGATVRRRAGGQAMELRRVGNVSIDLETPLDGILGFLIGLIVGIIVPGGLVFRALIGGIVGALVRNGLRNRLQSEANNFALDDLAELPIAESLDGVGVYLETLFNNPIEISPEGFLLSGQIAPLSVYPEVAESRARANGPYEFQAGVEAQLQGAGPAPATAFTWRTGDGAVLAAVAPNHVYPRRGFFVAEYAALDAQLILERHTREMTGVRVRNSRAQMDALPIVEGLEGDEVSLIGEFTDVAWLDAHRVIVDWGDDTLPTFGEVTETLGPPVTTGSFIARHRYCDDGEFIVTVILEDAQGGTARRETVARIENVPPEVDAGPDMFAHPCVPLRLVGRFTDPGWCDTHTAIWDFGDCSPPFPATVEQTHSPPMGRGTATATHCFDGCGAWQATLTVTDDDGGVGVDTIIVRTSLLRNGSFEDGFARVPLGDVGRSWQAYGDALTSSIPARDIFGCEHCVVCDGHTAQRIRAPGFRMVGLLQTIGANRGWEYQFAAMLHVAGVQATGRIGVDPRGRTDPNAPEIDWRSLSAGAGWQGVSTRAVAEADAVTVFIEFRDPSTEDLIVDCVTMQAYPCTPQKATDTDCPPEGRDEEPRTICVDLATVNQTGNLGTDFTFAGFFFISTGGKPLRTVTFGSPPGAHKLLIPDSDGPGSLLVELPEPALAVITTVAGPPDHQISLRALDDASTVVASDGSAEGELRTLRVEAQGIRRIELTSERRGTLQQLCIEVGVESPRSHPRSFPLTSRTLRRDNQRPAS